VRGIFQTFDFQQQQQKKTFHNFASDEKFAKFHEEKKESLESLIFISNRKKDEHKNNFQIN
jgi:hypothetical protein